MRRATRQFGTVIIVLIGALGFANWHMSVTNGRLREDAKRAGNMQPHVDEALQNLSDNESTQIRLLEEELEKLRTETQAINDAFEKRKRALAAAAPSQRPQSPWVNAGSATPEAAFQSVLWAVRAGETDALADMIAFDADGEAEADRFFEGLTDDMKQIYHDKRHLVAMLMAAKTPSYASMEMVSQKQTSDNTMEVEFHLGDARMNRKHEAFLRFQRDGAAWQLVVPARVIDAYRYIITRLPKVPESE